MSAEGSTKSLVIVLAGIIVLSGIVISSLLLCDTSPPAQSVAKPSDEFADAITKVSSSAVELDVRDYATGRNIIISRSHPKFESIIEYLEEFRVTLRQPRTVIRAGQTVEVEILHNIAFVLSFKLNDGSKVRFDYAGTELWFKSEGTIYGASANASLGEVLQQIIGSALQ